MGIFNPLKRGIRGHASKCLCDSTHPGFITRFGCSEEKIGSDACAVSGTPGAFSTIDSRVLPILPASYVLGSLVTAEAPGQATDKGLGSTV